MKLQDWKNRGNVKVKAEVSFCTSEVKFLYRILSEDIQYEALKAPEERKRRDGLWKENCLELFWSFDEKSYWEMNLSVSGDWQIYHFNEYRGKAESESRVYLEDLRQSFVGEVLQMEGRLTAPDLNWAQVKIFNPTVILDVFGEKHFFAFHHGEHPDFHRQDLWLKNSK